MNPSATYTSEDRRLLKDLYFRRNRIHTAIKLLEQIQRMRQKRTFAMPPYRRETI